MTADELRKRFPYISESCLRETLGTDHTPRTARTPDAQPAQPAPSLAGDREAEARRAGCPLVRFTLCRVKLLDIDAKYGSTKDLLDGLQYAGLIRGDREGEIDLEVRQEKVARYKEEKTVIELIWP